METYAKHNPDGLTILSSGRYLKPVGRHIAIAREPYGLAMSPDGKTLFVASDGVGQIITGWREANPVITKVHPPASERRKKGSNGGGVEFSPNGKEVYWSSGDSGAILIFNVDSPESITEASLNTEFDGRKFEDSYVTDVKVSADGKYLYCADVTNFRLVVMDLKSRKIIGSVPVGRYPYALAVVGDHVYAANIGLFEYSAIPSTTDERYDKRGVTFPPFGYPSKEARDGVEFEGRKIPASASRTCRNRFPCGG